MINNRFEPGGPDIAAARSRARELLRMSMVGQSDRNLALALLAETQRAERAERQLAEARRALERYKATAITALTGAASGECTHPFRVMTLDMTDATCSICGATLAATAPKEGA